MLAVGPLGPQYCLIFAWHVTAPPHCYFAGPRQDMILVYSFKYVALYFFFNKVIKSEPKFIYNKIHVYICTGVIPQ